MFQHTAARRRLHGQTSNDSAMRRFQHTAARRRLLKKSKPKADQTLVSTHSRPKAAAFAHFDFFNEALVSTHSRPKAAAFVHFVNLFTYFVSTHSRPKAAAFYFCNALFFDCCFNTQPPEGGCSAFSKMLSHATVSTHSRPKAAAIIIYRIV